MEVLNIFRELDNSTLELDESEHHAIAMREKELVAEIIKTTSYKNASLEYDQDCLHHARIRLQNGENFIIELYISKNASLASIHGENYVHHSDVQLISDLCMERGFLYVREKYFLLPYSAKDSNYVWWLRFFDYD